MMAQERIVGLKVKLLGKEETLKGIEDIGIALEESTQKLKDLGVAASRFDTITKKVEKLRGELGKLADEDFNVPEPNPRKPRTPTPTTPTTPTEEPQPDKEALKTLRDYLAELKRLKAAKENYDDVLETVGRLKNQQKELNREIRQSQREFEIVESAAGSYRQLNALLVQARDEFRQLSRVEREGETGRQLLDNIKDLDKELKDLDKEIGLYVRNVGNYQSAFEGLSSIANQFAAITGIAVGLNEAFQANVDVGEAIADVSKTTNLTIDEVRELAEVLKFRDTRTSLADQLGIAEIGGRLGIAKDQLEGFVESIDISNVALGDQFNNDAEQVTNTLAGLRNVLTTFQTDDVSKDLLNIGNALNVLETQGTATAPKIADFVNRFGGIATPLGASTESIFGLATTLDELQISAERGGTAVSKLLVDLAAAPNNFGQLVVDEGLIGSLEEFETLVNTNIVGALGLVTQASQQSAETNTEFAKRLDEIGISGAGVTEVFAKLGSNTDILSKRIDTAGQALGSTDSLLAEFEKKNKSLGASVDKLKNAFINLSVESQFQDFVSVGINGITQFVLALSSIPKFIKENQDVILALGIAVLSFNANLIATNATLLLTKARLTLVANATKAYTIVQRALNIALKANPIGLVISAVAALVGGLILLYRNSETVRNGINNLVSGFKLFPTQIQEQFIRLGLQAQKLGLEFKRFITLGDTSQIDKDIQDVENALIDSENRVKMAKENALKAEIARQKKAVDEKKKEEKQKLNLSKLTNAELLRLESSKQGELSKLAGEELKRREKAAEEELKRREKAAEEELKRREKAAEDRLKAAQKIADLENELIKNQFDRQKAQAQTASDREIASLVGTPSQIEEQTELILEKLNRQNLEIEKQRSEAQNKAKESLLEFNREIALIRGQLNIQSSEQNLSALDNVFKIDIAILKENFTEARALLVEQLENKEINEFTFKERIKELEEQQKEDLLAINQEKAVQELELQNQLTEQKLAALQLEFEREKELIAQRREERLQSLNDDFESGNIGQEDFNTGQAEILELQRLEELESLQQFEETKANLISEIALSNLEQQRLLNEQEVTINQEKNERLLANERKTAAARAKLIQTQLSVVGSFVSGVKGLLGQDEENRKKYGGILKALSLSEIAINLQKELSANALAAAQNPLNAATFGAAGAAQLAASNAVSIIRSAFAAATVLAQKFEFGGALDGGDSSSDSYQGTIHGQPHSQGGVKKIVGGKPVEVEGGEFQLQNGNETYWINKKSARVFKPLLQKLKNQSPKIYSQRKRHIASAINSFQSFGKSFQDGGIFTRNGVLTNNSADALAIRPLPAPNPISLNPDRETISQLLANSQTLTEMILIVEQKTESINSRIDRIQVVNDPEETVNFGNDAIELTNRIEL